MMVVLGTLGRTTWRRFSGTAVGATATMQSVILAALLASARPVESSSASLTAEVWGTAGCGSGSEEPLGTACSGSREAMTAHGSVSEHQEYDCTALNSMNRCYSAVPSLGHGCDVGTLRHGFSNISWLAG